MAVYGCGRALAGASVAVTAAVGDTVMDNAAEAAVRRGGMAGGLVLAAVSVLLMGGPGMAGGKGSARARRSRPVQALVSQGNRVNLALPFSVIRAGEPVRMRAADWISLAGLVVSAVGFSVVIKELNRIARASEGGEPSSESGRGGFPDRQLAG